MAWVPPTVADLKVRFPALGEADNAYLGLLLADAIEQAGDAWVDDYDRKLAVSYLTVHLFLTEGSGGSESVSAPEGSVIKAITVGDTKVEYATSSDSFGSKSSSGGLSSTAYGLKYRDLLRVNFPAIVLL